VPVPEAKTQVLPEKAPLPQGDLAPKGGRPVPVLPVVLGTAVVGILAGLVFVAARGSPAAPPASPSTAVTPSASSSAPDTPTAPAVDSTEAPPEEPPAAAPAASSGAPARLRVVPAHPKASAKPSCNPPYYEDPSGIRRVKPQCL
jgi:hypothetical protein